MLLIQHEGALTFSIIDRRLNKKDQGRDVLEKVKLIKDIRCRDPHRAHIEILHDLSLGELTAKHKCRNFKELHEAWRTTLDTNELNRKFYRKIQEWFFWAVQEVRFPHGGIDEEDQRNRIAMIRMLTRVIFCWFAKEKGLLPAKLFDRKTAVSSLKDFDPVSHKDGNYYLAFLQNLFFAVLSIPPKDRKLRNPRSYHGRNNHYMDHSRLRHRELFAESGVPELLFADIPFLNGGLFECLDYRSEEDGKNSEIRVDGFSDNPKKQAFVPNVLFFGKDQAADLHEALNSDKKREVSVDGLFTIFEDFKFTVTENTPIEEEIALDPELLGRIFENLLAEYNPETEKTARKETGSFYTPRTIVDYMVNESIKAYLQKVLCEKLTTVSSEDAEEGLDILFSYTEKDHAFTEEEKRVLLNAIYEVTILDPACGSGAFLMGMLQKLVYVLEKLDHGHDHWKGRILKDTPAPIKEETRRLLERSSADFLWKLGLIQRCIYGIDIQPIAVQIAKLRCFISLLVDFSVDERKENKGVPSLPNLDFKFVAADSLIKPPGDMTIEGGLGLVDPFYERFAELAEDYFFVRDHRKKKKLREQIEKIIEEKIRERESSVMSKREELRGAKGQKLNKRQAAVKKAHEAAIGKIEREVALWESYRNLFAFRNAPVRFFEPRYFFPESEEGFDIVIGNPPYVQIQKFPAEKKEAWKENHYRTYTAMGDIYCLFYERAAQLLKPGGHLCYITSNKWMRAEYGRPLRKYLSQKVRTRLILDFGMAQNFGSATTYTCVVQFVKKPPDGPTQSCYVTDDRTAMAEPAAYFARNSVPLEELNGGSWVLLSPARHKVRQIVEGQGTKLKNWQLKIYRGVVTGLNKAFYINPAMRKKILEQEPQAEEIIVPLLRGRHIERYGHGWDGTWMIFTRRGIDIDQYPVVKAHLETFYSQLRPKKKGDKTGRKPGLYEWYEIQDSIAYHEEFHQPKIIYPNMTKYLPFYYDQKDHFFINDKAFIMTSSSEPLPYLTAMLNSSLFRCCFRDNFPELLGNTYEVRKVFVDKIPIKRPDTATVPLFEGLVDYIQFVKNDANHFTSKGTPHSVMAAFLEELIDACVMELYFTDLMAKHGLSLMAEVTKIISPFRKNASEATKERQIRSFFEQAADPRRVIAKRLAKLKTDAPKELKVIREEGKV